MPGPGQSCLGTEPAAQDAGETILLVAWLADDVEGDLDEVRLVAAAVDFEGRWAGGQSGAAVAVGEPDDRRSARMRELEVERALSAGAAGSSDLKTPASYTKFGVPPVPRPPAQAAMGFSSRRRRRPSGWSAFGPRSLRKWGLRDARCATATRI